MKVRPVLTSLLITLPALAQQSPAPPTDAERARWTMSDMRTLATAIESFAVDHNAYPQAANLTAIVSAIEPIYIRKAPLRDAWGHPFLYECKDGRSYTIVSLGADGTQGPDDGSKSATTESYAADAVFTDGQFVRSWAYR